MSLVLSFLYYTPWIFGATRANLGPYLLAFFWFMGAWIVAIIYGVKAFKLRRTNSSLCNKYLIGVAAVLISYIIVWAGMFNGYMVTV